MKSNRNLPQAAIDSNAANKLYNLLALHNDNLIYKREGIDLQLMAKSPAAGMTQVRGMLESVDPKTLANNLQIDLPVGYLPNHIKSNVYSVLMNIIHQVNTNDADYVSSYALTRAIKIFLASDVRNIERVLNEYPNYDSAIQDITHACNRIISQQAPIYLGLVTPFNQNNIDKPESPLKKSNPFSF